MSLETCTRQAGAATRAQEGLEPTDALYRAEGSGAWPWERRRPDGRDAGRGNPRVGAAGRGVWGRCGCGVQGAPSPSRALCDLDTASQGGAGSSRSRAHPAAGSTRASALAGTHRARGGQRRPTLELGQAAVGNRPCGSSQATGGPGRPGRSRSGHMAPFLGHLVGALSTPRRRGRCPAPPRAPVHHYARCPS